MEYQFMLLLLCNLRFYCSLYIYTLTLSLSHTHIYIFTDMYTHIFRNNIKSTTQALHA